MSIMLEQNTIGLVFSEAKKERPYWHAMPSCANTCTCPNKGKQLPDMAYITLHSVCKLIHDIA